MNLRSSFQPSAEFETEIQVLAGAPRALTAGAAVRPHRSDGAPNLAERWNVAPQSVIENSRTQLSAALFFLNGDDPLEVGAEPHPSAHIVSVHLNGQLRKEFFTDGRRVYQGSPGEGDSMIVPAGQRPAALLGDATAAEFMHLYIPTSLVERFAEDDREGGGRHEIKDHFARADREAHRMALLVRDEMRSPGLASHLFLDTVAAGLAVHLYRHWSNHATPVVAPIRHRGGLAAWQVKQVKDLINERLTEAVGLDELASTVGLSTFHFARSFKQSTGLAPHRYQTTVRLAKARELLARTKMSILEIALAVGYDSGQTLARAFRREYGSAPMDWRRQVAVV